MSKDVTGRNEKISGISYQSLRQKDPNDPGLLGQRLINNSEANKLRGRIRERIDGHEEVEKWDITDILDSHDDLSKSIITYQVKWKHQKPTWQVATDLKGQEEAILKFHERYPEKPGPPSWVKYQIKKRLQRGWRNITVESWNQRLLLTHLEPKFVEFKNTFKVY
ncbi:hypothetical protein K3495_g3801 [Podosphaera aphanis]|nr:hypothetical protein K3495_g3801 [Podosphaera aphanis]